MSQTPIVGFPFNREYLNISYISLEAEDDADFICEIANSIDVFLNWMPVKTDAALLKKID